MIHLLWPTARPTQFKEVHAHWIESAAKPLSISTLVAVDSEEEKQQLSDFEVVVLNRQHPGVAYASFVLGRTVNCVQNDIIVLASDDFISPVGWDVWITKHLSRFDGCLVVRDGCQDGRTNKRGRCVTIPIMTHNCLERLNRIIYHPSYMHYYSDTELWYNLHEMRLLKNFRRVRYPLFEHKHWSNGKRNRDEVDVRLGMAKKKDKANFFSRMQLPLIERLVV